MERDHGDRTVSECGPIVPGNWFQQDRFQHGEFQPVGGCDGGRQRLMPWPGSGDWRQQSSFLPWPRRRWEFDCGRTLLLAEWWSDVEPRNPHGRFRFRISHGGNLQREPGSDGNVLRFHSASRAVLLDGWPELYAADYATDRGAGIGELSGEFERNDLPDLSRRVRGGPGAQ